MIRTVVLAGLVLAAASPALAYQVSSVPAPQSTAHFANYSMFTHMMPGSTSETYRMRDAAPGHTAMVVYELPKGKPADRLDMTSARDNPFMAQPERKSEPAEH